MRRQHLGVGLARHQIARRHREVLQCPHGVDGTFDPLARPNQTPGQNDRPTHPIGYDTCSGDGSAVGDGDHLGGVDVEAGAQADSGRLGHDHDPVCQSCDVVQNGALMRCRVGEDRVRDHDGGHMETAENLEHLVSVGPSVEAVLVLHDATSNWFSGVRTCNHGARETR